MIKGLAFVHPASTPAVFDRLGGFLAAIGLEPGHAFESETSRGRSFRAPLGTIEIVDGLVEGLGQTPSGTPAELFLEVTSLEAVRDAARLWLQQAFGEEEAGRRLTEVTDTGWKSRQFSVEPVPQIPLTIWEWADPLKGRPAAVEGDLVATGMRFGIVVARWNAVITDRLLQGTLDAILRSGARYEDVQIVRVPGAWEVPDAARKLAESGTVDGIVTLGVLLRGETAHYEAIYNEVSRGIGQSQQETGVPHAFGVLTCETLEQALDRAGLKAGNKGFEAGSAAIEMVSLHRKLEASHVKLAGGGSPMNATRLDGGAR
jgi:6,7-dimethyl-8-ribityllumazine synthase